VIAELGDADTEVFLVGPAGAAERTTLGALLPRVFSL
jgi:cytidine deaminase